MDAPEPEKVTSEEMKIILEEWKTVIQTQMHFNDMIMKIRTTGISIVLSVFGAAAYSLQFDKLYLHVFGFSFHGAVPIVSFGLIMMFSTFIIDYFYYFKMLLGAVERGMEIDKAYGDRMINGVKMYGMTTKIGEKIGQPGASKFIILAFYGITFLVGIIFLIVILIGYIPEAI